MINFNLIDKKNHQKKQRNQKFTSCAKKAILEVINQEFLMTNQNLLFSIADIKISVDYRYCDIYVVFFDTNNNDENYESDVIEKLNLSHTHKGYKSGFVPLKIAIMNHLQKKMKLKYPVEIRFRKVSDDYFIVNFNQNESSNNI